LNDPSEQNKLATKTPKDEKQDSADAQVYGMSGGIRGIRANWLNGLPNIAT
jgi:hypothetical protein